MISTRNTNLSIVHRFLQRYYEEGQENPITPKSILFALDESLDELSREYKFLNESILKKDISSIGNYYRINGYHLLKLDYILRPDQKIKGNVLEFIIDEGERFKISKLNVLGLDLLPERIANKVKRSLKIKIDDPYDEINLIRSVNRIKSILKNSGYYYADFEIKPIVIDTSGKSNEIDVSFLVGERQRFGKTRFIDVRKGEKNVTREFKEKMLAYKEGEWYSEEKINQTNKNLLGLGTFESVRIDTINSNKEENILSFVIISNYRKQQDFDGGLFYNQTENNLANGGLTALWSHQNIGGNAQQLSVDGSWSARNPFDAFVTAITENRINDQEWSFGVSLRQPYIWTFNPKWGMRSGLAFEPKMSFRRVREFFNLYDLQIPLRLPITFKENSDVTRAEFSLNLSGQKVENFDDFINKSSQDPDSIRLLRETLIVYDEIDEFVGDAPMKLTSVLVGFNILGDKRNNPFNPTKGWRVNINSELSLGYVLGRGDFIGLAEYVKLLASYTQFFEVNNTSVFAIKLLGGAIDFKSNQNKYIPLNKQLFAGGPNSNRGWAPRKLRYSPVDRGSLGDSSLVSFFEDFVGNQGLFELSFEYRINFTEPSWAPQTLAEHIASSGLVGFVDIGNAFAWMVTNENSKFDLSEIQNMAISFGLGYRYNTPVGPVRIDFGFPVYGLLDGDHRLTNGFSETLSKMQFHIGLGHAF